MFFPSGRCNEYSQVIDVVCFHFLSLFHTLYRSQSQHSLHFGLLNISSFHSAFLSFPPIQPFFGIFISLLKFLPLSKILSHSPVSSLFSHYLFSTLLSLSFFPTNLSSPFFCAIIFFVSLSLSFYHLFCFDRRLHVVFC